MGMEGEFEEHSEEQLPRGEIIPVPRGSESSKSGSGFACMIDADQVKFTQGAALVVLAGDASIVQGGAMLNVAQNLSVQQGGSQWMIASDARIEQGGAGIMIAQRVEAPNARVGILLAGNVEGDVQTVLDAAGALRVGAAFGAVFGLLMLLRRLLSGR